MLITFFVNFHSFILETYIAPLQETTTQRRAQPSHGQKGRTSERCKIWKGGPSARNAAQRGDHRTEKPLRCIIAKRARGTKNSPLAAERRTRRAAKTDTGQQRTR